MDQDFLLDKIIKLTFYQKIRRARKRCRHKKIAN